MELAGSENSLVKSSLVETYEFTDDLYWFFLNKLPELESKDKAHYSELRDTHTHTQNTLRDRLIQKGMVKHDSDLFRHGYNQ
jgi:hypothetical protein